MRRATITGWGKCVPPAVLGNSDLEQLTDTTDDWITTRTGIKERRITHVENSDMAAVAGKHALAAAGVDAADIDTLIVATCTPDRLIPSAASFVQPKVGAVNAGVMDINAACSGFVYGITIGNALIALGRRREGAPHRLGEAVGAARHGRPFHRGVVSAMAPVPSCSRRPMGPTVCSPPTWAPTARSPGSSPPPDSAQRTRFRRGWTRSCSWDGREVFRNAVTEMGNAAAKAVADAGLELDDVDLLIPHQANVRIIDATARRMKVPEEKVYVNIASYGNTSAASIPIALAEALEEGRIGEGDHVVFVAFGGGLTWAAAALRWGPRTEAIATSDAALPGTDLTAVDLIKKRQAERRARRGG